jgi:hypothetical protein
MFVLLINGGAVFIRNNALAFRVSLATCMLGMFILAAALVAWRSHWISGFAFMVLLGQGLYLPYVAVHTTIFERLLAMTRAPGNIGFLMYAADAVGYLGYVAVMLTRNFGDIDSGHTDVFTFFIDICWVGGGLCAVCLLVSWLYFTMFCQTTADAPADSDSAASDDVDAAAPPANNALSFESGR